MIVESGATGLTGMLGTIGADTLTDPAIQGAIQESVARALESDRVKSSMRPYFIEGAAWAAAGVMAALVLFRVKR